MICRDQVQAFVVSRDSEDPYVCNLRTSFNILSEQYAQGIRKSTNDSFLRLDSAYSSLVGRIKHRRNLLGWGFGPCQRFKMNYGPFEILEESDIVGSGRRIEILDRERDQLHLIITNPLGKTLYYLKI